MSSFISVLKVDIGKEIALSDSKVVFLDVDGTITTYENVIPESAKRAIRTARANGHKVLMCTGRSKAENPPELTEIGFDGMIGGNGSYVEVDNQVIMHVHIDAGQCRHIVDWCHERGLEFYLESNNGLFASERFREAGKPVLQLYMGRKGVEHAEDLEVEDVMHGIVFDGELYRDDVNKVSFIEALGADMADTVAMGDAKVDIPMFEACATSVCMGSGGEEAKAAADFVTTDVDKDGLWNAFSHLCLV